MALGIPLRARAEGKRARATQPSIEHAGGDGHGGRTLGTETLECIKTHKHINRNNTKSVDAQQQQQLLLSDY